MRAVQITRFGGPEVMDVVDVPEPEAGPGQQVYDVSAAGVNFADTHHRESRNTARMTTAWLRDAGSPISTTSWR
ncbi:hypothetical protein [Modestobacter sp. SYSU DS0511]